MDMWICNTGQFKYLVVISRQDGVVEEIKNYLRKSQSVKTICMNSFVQLREKQSNREIAESILGKPLTISRTEEGVFYTYYIKIDTGNQEIYIEYDDNNIISRLICKPFNTNQMAFLEE
jgi:hypothetical protein